MYFITKELWFPHPNEADFNGIVAIGGDLSPQRLLLAYNNGIFPWYNEYDPIMWWSPKERMVLFPEHLHVSKSMKSVLKKDKFKLTVNKNFKEVILNCSSIERKNETGTWINEDMISAYIKLNKMGYALSFETWYGNELVGGLYGIYLKDKAVFCGESMFSKVSNASKFAFIKMVEYFKDRKIKLIDCQLHNPHLESHGGIEISRKDFLDYLK